MVFVLNNMYFYYIIEKILFFVQFLQFRFLMESQVLKTPEFENPVTCDSFVCKTVTSTTQKSIKAGNSNLIL